MDDTMKNNILIVDDEKANIMYLDNILSADYEVYAAKDGPGAIEFANEFLPDLILLDIIMPGMDGYEVFKALRASERTKCIPIIFITGLSGSDNETKGLALGAEDYISKPFSDEIVKLRVKNQLKIISQMRTIIENEIAERSTRTKLEFLSRMNHEMRTPLTAIMGMTSVLLREDDPNLIYEHAKVIDASSRDLLRLIDVVLDIAGIKNGQITLEYSDFNVRAMVREVLDQTKESRKQKEQSLSVKIDDAVPRIVYCDKKRLSQVLDNLLSNAIKFTGKQGSIKIHISAQEHEGETAVLLFEVDDNGIGISAAQQQELFTLFKQADESADRKFGGVGSGLFVAKHIVELMGGQIWVESELGRGSKFIFSVKVKVNPPAKPEN